MYNKKQALIIPGVNTSDFVNYVNNSGDPMAIAVLSFLLAWRAQLAITLCTWLSVQEIQKLDTMRWIAKELSSNQHIRYLSASIAVGRTLGFELTSLKPLNPKERSEYLAEIALNLSQETPPRGAKILENREINEHNLNSHRHAIMAQLVGLWQARPLFDPSLVVRGGGLVTMDFQSSCKLIGETIVLVTNKKDEIFPQDDLQEVIGSIELYLGIIPSEFIEENKILPSWYTHKSTSPQFLTFNDGFNLGNASNKVPLELDLAITRTSPTFIEKETIPSDDTDPILALAVASHNATWKLQQESKNPRARTSPVIVKDTKPVVIKEAKPKASKEPKAPKPPSKPRTPRKPKEG